MGKIKYEVEKLSKWRVMKFVSVLNKMQVIHKKAVYSWKKKSFRLADNKKMFHSYEE